jgi:hypothetical protein
MDELRVFSAETENLVFLGNQCSSEDLGEKQLCYGVRIKLDHIEH